MASPHPAVMVGLSLLVVLVGGFAPPPDPEVQVAVGPPPAPGTERLPLLAQGWTGVAAVEAERLPRARGPAPDPSTPEGLPPTPEPVPVSPPPPRAVALAAPPPAPPFEARVPPAIAAVIPPGGPGVAPGAPALATSAARPPHPEAGSEPASRIAASAGPLSRTALPGSDPAAVLPVRPEGPRAAGRADAAPPAPPPPPQPRLVTADRVNLRSGPSLDAEVLNLMSPGTRLFVVGITGDWAEVLTETGGTAFVWAQYLGPPGATE